MSYIIRNFTSFLRYRKIKLLVSCMPFNKIVNLICFYSFTIFLSPSSLLAMDKNDERFGEIAQSESPNTIQSDAISDEEIIKDFIRKVADALGMPDWGGNIVAFGVYKIEAVFDPSSKLFAVWQRGDQIDSELSCDDASTITRNLATIHDGILQEMYED